MSNIESGVYQNNLVEYDSVKLIYFFLNKQKWNLLIKTTSYVQHKMCQTGDIEMYKSQIKPNIW
jgi:TRAP-type mannitol/chloroaromatic compound transport system substrate-binding protein